jgi:MFS family permease
VVTPLREAGFRRLWLAGLISTSGDWLLLVSLPILVFQRTGSTLGTAVAFLIELVPRVLVAPLGGRLAERLDRRRLLVTVSVAQAIVLLPLLVEPSLPVIYAVIAVEGALAAVFGPAQSALLPTLIGAGQLVRANSLIGLSQNLGRLIGAGLGGLLLAIGALPAIVLADAVSFLAAVALLIRVPPGVSASRPDVIAAGHPFRRRPVRVGLVVVALTSTGQGVFVVLFVVFVARVLHGGAAENGLLRGVQAIGAIAGGILLAGFHRIGSARLTVSACLAFGILLLAIWNLPHLSTAEPIYVALFVATGIPAVAMSTGLNSVLQESTIDGERGPVFAAIGMVYAAGQAIGMLAAGLLGDRFGVIPMLDAQAVAFLLAGLVALIWLTARPAHQNAIDAGFK